MDSTLLSPNDLGSLIDDDRFKAMPYESRKQAGEQALSEASQWVTQNGGWTPDSWKQFGEAAKGFRQEIYDSETVGEGLAWAGKGVVRGVTDLAKVAGTTALDLGIVEPNSTFSDPQFKAPLGTVLPALGRGTQKIVDALDVKMAEFNPQGKALDDELSAMRKEIDEGTMPLDAEGLQNWLDQRGSDVAEKQAYWYHSRRTTPAPTPEQTQEMGWAAKLQAQRDAEPVSEDLQRAAWGNSMMADPINAKLLGGYMATRNPEIWDQLTARLKTDPTTHALRDANDKAREATGLAQFLNRNFGEGASQMIDEAGDPMEWVGMVFAPMKGVQAIRKGRTLLQRGADLAKGVASEVLSEQGSLTADNPFATLQQRMDVAKETVLGSIGLLGTGAAAKVSTDYLSNRRNPAATNASANVDPGPSGASAPPASQVGGSTPPTGTSVTVDGQQWQFDPTAITRDQVELLAKTGGLDPYLAQGMVRHAPGNQTAGTTGGPVDRTPVRPVQLAAEDLQSGLADMGTPRGNVLGALQLAQVGQNAPRVKPSTALVDRLPALPQDPTGTADILNFVNGEFPLQVPRKGTTGRIGDSDWREAGDLPPKYRTALMREGKSNIDEVAQAAYERGLINDPTPDALMGEIRSAIANRETQTTAANQQQTQLTQQEAAQTAFEKDARLTSPTAQPIDFDALQVGSTIQTGRATGIVADLQYDTDGRITSATLNTTAGPVLISPESGLRGTTTTPAATRPAFEASADMPFRRQPDATATSPTAPTEAEIQVKTARIIGESWWAKHFGVQLPSRVAATRAPTAADGFQPGDYGSIAPAAGYAQYDVVITPGKENTAFTWVHEVAHITHIDAALAENPNWDHSSIGDYNTPAPIPKIMLPAMKKIGAQSTTRKLKARATQLNKTPKNRWTRHDKMLAYLADPREIWARAVEQVIYYLQHSATLPKSTYGSNYADVAVLTEAEIQAIIPDVQTAIGKILPANQQSQNVALAGNGNRGQNAATRPGSQSRTTGAQNSRANGSGSGRAGAGISNPQVGPKSVQAGLATRLQDWALQDTDAAVRQVTFLPPGQPESNFGQVADDLASITDDAQAAQYLRWLNNLPDLSPAAQDILADINWLAGPGQPGIAFGPRSRRGVEGVDARPPTAEEITENQTRQSQFGERVQADERLTEQMRAAEPTTFAVQGQQQAANEATAIIRELGLEAAQARFRTDDTLRMPVRIAGMMKVALTYDAQAALARRQGDDAGSARADALTEAAIEAKADLEYLGNDAGRNLAMFNTWARMSPDGQIRRMERQLGQQVQERMAADIGLPAAELETMVAEEVNNLDIDAILDEVLQDDTAPRPVNPRTGEPSWLRLLSSAQNFAENVANSTTVERMVQAIDDALKVLKGKLFSDPLLITPIGQAVLRATRTLLLSGQRLAQAVAGGIAQVRANMPQAVIDDTAMSRAVLGEITRQIIRPIIRRLALDPAYTAQTAQQDLIAAGVGVAEARRLSQQIANRRPRIQRAAQDRVRQALLRRLNPTTNRRARRVSQRLQRPVEILMQATGAGIATERAFREAYAAAHDIPMLSRADWQRLRQLAATVNLLPEGVLRTQKATELLNEMALIRGIPARDLLTSMWYANILSGLSTQGVNLWGNAAHLIRAVSMAGLNPRSQLNLMRGMIAGLPAGLREARAMLREGIAHKGLKWDDHQASGALELLTMQPNGPQGVAQWISYLGSLGGLTRYVFRAMGAIDQIFWHTAQEGHNHVATARLLRQGNLRPGTPAYNAAYIQALGGDAATAQADIQQAQDELQAAGEPVTALAVNRRAWEIRQLRRPEALREEGKLFADRMVFQQTPEGSGHFIDVLIGHLQNFRPFGIPVLLPLVPFRRIIANLFESALDFTPIGIIRAGIGHHILSNGHRPQRQFETLERRERALASAFGMSTSLMALSMAWQYKDEPDETVPFMPYASGPSDANRRAQMPAGWRPHTIKVGRNYISYAETPMGPMLAAVGGILDRTRYGSSQKPALERLALALASSVKSFQDLGALSSIKETLEVMTQEGAYGQAPSIKKLALKPVPGFVPAQGLLRDVSRLLDPSKISDADIWGALFRDVPILKSAGTPQLNILGETVRHEGIPVVNRFVTPQRRDPVWEFVGQHRLTIPSLPRTIEIGNYLTGGQREQARALGLIALENGVMTPTQKTRFVKRQGEILRQSILRLRNSTNNQSPTPERTSSLQKQLNASARAAREIAMREEVEKLR